MASSTRRSCRSGQLNTAGRTCRTDTIGAETLAEAIFGAIANVVVPFPRKIDEHDWMHGSWLSGIESSRFAVSRPVARGWSLDALQEDIIMTNDIIIRALEQSDFPAIAELHNQPRATAGTLGVPLQSVADFEQRFRIDAFNRMLVAELDGRLVGDAGLHLNRGRRAHSGSLGMTVHDDFQGRGVGTGLMAALIDLADNWYNLLRLDLQVYTDNAAAIHLYEKFGFVIEGTLRSYAYRAGVFVDAYYMARLRNCPPVVVDPATVEQITINEASRGMMPASGAQV